jgi:hypothetical protein
VQFFQPVLGDAETPGVTRLAQAALDRPAAPFQQVAAGGQESGGEHQDEDEGGEQPGRVERQ